MTLIEVVVGLAIGAIMLGVVYRSFFNVISALDRVRPAGRELKIAAHVFSRLRADLNGAYSSPRVESVFNGSSRSLDFFTTYGLYPEQATAESGLRRVRYVIDQGDAAAPLPSGWRWYRWEEERKISLGDYYRSIQFRFYDGRQWLDAWDSRWQGRLPRAVELQVEIPTPRQEIRRFRTVFEIPATGEWL